MFNIVTTSRPIMPDQDAHLLLQDDDSFLDFTLKEGLVVNIKVENQNEKYCTGWYDLKTSTNHPCESGEVIPKQYQDCFSCRTKTGFNPAFYNTTALSSVQEEFNKQPHLVYVAYFGNEIFKVGITAARRGAKRLYEQGALYHVILTEAPNATVARNLESRMVRQGLKESVLRVTKSNILKDSLDMAKEEGVFTDFIKQTEFADAKIEANLDTYFFGNYPNESIKAFEPGQEVSGVVRGVVGRYLVLENNQRLYGVWLSDYFGKKVQITDEIVPLERDLQQVSLF